MALPEHLLKEDGDKLLLETGDSILLNLQPYNILAMPYLVRLAYRGSTEKIYVSMKRVRDDLAAFDVESPTLEISKNGGAFAAPSDGTWTEIDHGVYTVQLDATDKNTYGPLMVRAVQTSTPTTYETQVLCHVGVNNEDEGGIVSRVITIHREVLG